MADGFQEIKIYAEYQVHNADVDLPGTLPEDTGIKPGVPGKPVEAIIEGSVFCTGVHLFYSMPFFFPNSSEGGVVSVTYDWLQPSTFLMMIRIHNYQS